MDAVLSLTLSVVALTLIGLTYDVICRRGRVLTVSLLAVCLLADLATQPWNAASVVRQYRADAMKLVARFARANAPRSCYFPRICVARTSIDNGVSQRKS